MHELVWERRVAGQHQHGLITISGRLPRRYHSWNNYRDLFCALSLKLKSLQLNRIQFSRKSYPRVSNAFVLNNPLYNLKICDYLFRNSMSNFDKLGRFPYWKYCKKPDFQCEKSAPNFYLFYLKFSWNDRLIL